MKANLNQLICIYKVNRKYIITYINTIDNNIYGSSDIQYQVTTSTRLILTPEADQSYDSTGIFEILNTMQLCTIVHTAAWSATMHGWRLAGRVKTQGPSGEGSKMRVSPTQSGWLGRPEIDDLRTRFRVVRIDSLHFLARCHKRRLNQPLSIFLSLSIAFLIVLFIRATFCVLLVYTVICLFVVLIKLSILAKWLATKNPLRKPNCGEGIVATKPRWKSVYDFFCLLYCFIVLWCICLVPRPYVMYSILHGVI